MRLSFQSLSLFIAFFLFFFSCTDNSNYLPGYSGNEGEILLVMKASHWNSSPGEAARKIFQKAQYGLPQDEPVFDLVQVAPKDFERIFQTHRNIVMVDFSAKTDSVATEIKMNSWAKGQLLINITAPDEQAFQKFMESYGDNIANKIKEVELGRLVEKNRIHGKTLDKKYNNSAFSITLQKDSYIAAEDSNFFWIRVERGRNLGGYEHQISQGLFIYWEPYRDTSMFSPANIIIDNDSIAKKFIKGNTEGSFMVTSFKADPPQARNLKYDNKYAVEIRGLWRMENDFMGGPFICLRFLDEKNNMVFTAEGYVFAPQFDKLMYLREVEAMVKSIKLPGNN